MKFFRGIRQQLMNTDKFTRYIIYAVGEILLVVIGILIALSINNWKQEIDNRKLEFNYLERFRIDLMKDSTNINVHYNLLILKSEILQFIYSGELDSIEFNSNP